MMRHNAIVCRSSLVNPEHMKRRLLRGSSLTAEHGRTKNKSYDVMKQYTETMFLKRPGYWMQIETENKNATFNPDETIL
jgi:hypothetical protein